MKRLVSKLITFGTVGAILALAVASLFAQVPCPLPCDEELPPPVIVVTKEHAKGFPYPQLPTENICKCCFDACNDDLCVIHQGLEIVTDYRNRQNLLAARDEANRLRQVWWAAWSVTWPGGEKKYRDEWTANLIDLIGYEAFVTGELPLPLSAR